MKESVTSSFEEVLDTFPYNGVTTSFEAIWMGVPVITMVGYNFNSRCGESINKNLNLEYLIAKDEEEYISKAINLSNDTKKFFFDRPDSNSNQKIFNLSISRDSVKVNSTNIDRPNPNLIKDPIIRKNDIYGLEFYNKDNELIYKLGIGDPFMVRLQHIDMEDKEHYAFEAPISNFNVVIPIDINPSYVSLIRRNNQNIYSEVSRYILN